MRNDQSLHQLFNDDQSSLFVVHADSTSALLSTIIANLDDLHSVADRSADVGRRHVDCAAGDFDADRHCQVFTDAFMQCLVNGGAANRSGDYTETINAWRQLAYYLGHHMKIGCDRERRRRMRSSSMIQQ